MIRLNLLEPNVSVDRREAMTLYGVWAAVFLIVWTIGAGKILPSPIELMRAVPGLWANDGLADALWASVTLDIEAVLALTVVSLLIAYGTVTPIGRPFARLFSIGRFNGFVGIPLIFTLLLGNPHHVKVALLVFGAGVFTVPSLVKAIEDIPKQQYDLARTLRMSEWRIVWEVVILGTADQFLDVLMTNVAMVWMLTPMVEVLFRYEGGIGALMVDLNKHLNLAGVYAMTFMVLGVGLAQDILIGQVKAIACPYARLGMER